MHTLTPLALLSIIFEAIFRRSMWPYYQAWQSAKRSLASLGNGLASRFCS